MSQFSFFPETQSTRGDFPSTQWSAILAMSDGESPKARSALERICQNYWYPIYAFLRRKGYSYAEAQDTTQQFFLRLLEKDSILLAQRNRGKFRSFLLTSLNHFLIDEWRRQNARKRGGGQIVSLAEFSDAESKFQKELFHEQTPDRIYDRAWALTLLEKSMIRLRRNWIEDGKESLFDQLKAFILSGPRKLSCHKLALELQMTEGALKMAICRLRREFREILCKEISKTVEHPKEIDGEIQYFIKVLTVNEPPALGN